METEVWKDIPWYEWLYTVSNTGSVKSLRYRKKHIEWIINWGIDWPWYRFVFLSKNSISKRYHIHRLVALAFINNVYNKPCINHIDWIKINNDISNLEWCTYSENHKHAHDNWLMDNNSFKKNHPHKWKFWADHNKSVSVWQYAKDWILIRIWWGMSEAERWTHIDQASISRVCRWEKITAGWFIWKYS